MANTFTVSGTATLALDGVRTVGTFATNATLNGSNGNMNSQDVTTSSWAALDTSSLTDLRFAWFYNTSDTGSVTIATGSAGQNVVMMLYPEDSALLTWSGSTVPTLYAKAATKNSVIQYILAES